MRSELVDTAGSYTAVFAALMQGVWAVWLAGCISTHDIRGASILAALLAIFTVGLFFDFRRRAIAKGYRGAWGLLALLSYLGWVVLHALPDRRPESLVGGFEVIVPKKEPPGRPE